MVELTRTIILRALFSSEAEAGFTAFAEALTAALGHLNQRLWTLLNWPTYLPTPNNRRFNRALQALEAFIEDQITQHHQNRQGIGDLLSILLQLRDQHTGSPMSDRQLRDEIMTLCIAGYTTAATALTWTWILLSQHPMVNRRLHEELRAVTPDRLATPATLPYTRMVINESMRLYPPTWITARTPVEDDELGSCRIRAGSVVLLSPYVMHRHPAFWDHPGSFDPTRFKPERSLDRPRYAYFPFGGGPRICIGQGLALMEMQLIVAMVARHYSLHLVPEQTLLPQPGITLQPPRSVRVRLEPQEAATA